MKLALYRHERIQLSLHSFRINSMLTTTKGIIKFSIPKTGDKKAGEKPG